MADNYTITANDGAIAFSSDFMPGTTIAGSIASHAYYMEGWDPLTRALRECQCIGKLVNCSDGGNDTMLQRALPILALPRLVMR